MTQIMKAAMKVNSYGCGRLIRPSASASALFSFEPKRASCSKQTRKSYVSRPPSFAKLWPPNSASMSYINSMPLPTRRLFSSARYSDIETETEIESNKKDRRGRRVWKARQERDDGEMQDGGESGSMALDPSDGHWDAAVDDVNDRRVVDGSLSRICEQEREGGRMKQSQLGVLREDPHDDMRLLLENYTATALASALRDREDTLQHCANLLAHNQLQELSKILRPYEQKYILQRRHKKEKTLDFRHGGFGPHNIELLRRGLNRMPRRVSTAHAKRAGVVLPLCNVDGVPCILFEKRSSRLRAHPDEVCLPGGIVSDGIDKSIVQTCLREMEEEIGIGHNKTTVLGVLRCNWGEVHHLVGVAVTPVVCFLGEIGESQLNLNPSEVAECFTVPLESFLDRERWVHKQHYAPFFTGGPHIIWGLTGYIVHRFVMDIIERHDAVFANDT